MSHMSIEQIKAELPEVKVKVNGSVVTGHIYGRNSQFPTVYTKQDSRGWPFAWETIQQSLVTGKPLLV